MKKIITLLFSMIFLMASFGYAYQNRLTISSNSQYRLQVYIDGRFYPVEKNNGDRDIQLNNLRPGTRNIKIYQQKGSRHGSKHQNNRNMELLYNTNLYIKQGYDVDIIINRFGKAFMDERPMNNYDDREYNNGDGNRFAMDDHSFTQLKQTIIREAFDDTKMNISKAALGNNYLSSYQIKELVSLLNFENSKLDLAKYCYRCAIDPENYYVVSDALTFSNSKKELMQFIQQSR